MEIKIFKTADYDGYYTIENNTIYYYTNFKSGFVGCEFLEDEDELNYDLDYYQKMDIDTFFKIEGLQCYTVQEWNEIIKQNNPSAGYFHAKRHNL